MAGFAETRSKVRTSRVREACLFGTRRTCAGGGGAYNDTHISDTCLDYNRIVNLDPLI